MHLSQNNYRFCWQRLHATQLFVEHVMLAHPTIDLKVTARRMSKVRISHCIYTKFNVHIITAMGKKCRLSSG